MRTLFVIVFAAGSFTALAGRAPTAPEDRAATLKLRVPFEPTAFPSADRTYLFYEVHISNGGDAPVTLRRIEVFDAARATRAPIATIEAEQLNGILQPFGGQPSTTGRGDNRQLAAGGTVVAFMSIARDRGVRVPDKLVHRVVTVDFATQGAAIGTHHTKLHVLGPPLEGANWLAADGPSNDEDNHHRRGLLTLDGHVVISRRYAIDWKQVKNGASFSGDADDKHSYYAYGKVALAVADGRVITAKDGLPDNVPGHNEKFRPAVPITLDTVAGNTITIDLGDGQFAYYCHLQQGSLRVKVGDRVQRGQTLALVGASGDAREPHLHFEVTTDSHFAAGEGMPYLIEHYNVTVPFDGIAGLRTRELPLNNMTVDFGKGHPD